MTRILALILLTLSTAPSLAQTSAQTEQYQVEILVFETGALRGWTEEFWPWPESVRQTLTLDLTAENGPETLENAPETLENAQNAGFPAPAAATQTAQKTDLQKIRGTPSPEAPDLDSLLLGEPPHHGPNWLRQIRPVPDKQWLLKKALQRLTPAKGYRIVLHRAWIQPALPDTQSVALAINEITEQDEQLDGTVRFYKNRYAHMDISLNLSRRIPANLRETFARHENIPLDMLPEYWPFHLSATRKMKSGEWHYLDHPLFGALIVIQRINP